MPGTKRLLAIVAILAVNISNVRASDDPAAQNPVVDSETGKKLDDVLARWEARNKSIRSLSIKFRRIDEYKFFGERKDSLDGLAKIQSPSLFYVEYSTPKVGDKRAEISERLVCDGKTFFQFSVSTRQIFVLPLPENRSEQTSNFRPLPFVLGVKAESLRERYEMSLVREDADSYTIRAAPKALQSHDDFVQATITLNKERLFPSEIRVETSSPVSSMSFQTFTCSVSDIVENPEIRPVWLDGESMVKALESKRWQVVRNPNIAR